MLYEQDSPEFGVKKPTPTQADGVPLSQQSVRTDGSFIDIGKVQHFMKSSGILSSTDRDLSTSLNEAVEEEGEENLAAKPSTAGSIPVGVHATPGDVSSGSGGPSVGQYPVWGTCPSSAANDLIAQANRGLTPVVNQKESVQEMTNRFEAESSAQHFKISSPPKPSPAVFPDRYVSRTYPEVYQHTRASSPEHNQSMEQEVASPTQWISPSPQPPVQEAPYLKERGRSQPTRATPSSQRSRMDTSFGPMKRNHARGASESQVKRSQTRQSFNQSHLAQKTM